MSRFTRTLVVGLGSHHGDDRAGWLVADSLSLRCQDIQIRRALIPLDLLDWLDKVDRLHVCDAYEATPGCVSLVRLNWSAGRLMTEAVAVNPSLTAGLRGGGSHDFGLPEVLQLAESTSALPRHVTIWGVPGWNFHPGSPLTVSTQSVVSAAVEAIVAELPFREQCHA